MLYVISGLLCGLYWRLIRIKQKRETRIWLKKHPEYVAQREEVYRKWAAALKEREEQELAEMRARVEELEAKMQVCEMPKSVGNTDYRSGLSCRADE